MINYFKKMLIVFTCLLIALLIVIFLIGLTLFVGYLALEHGFLWLISLPIALLILLPLTFKMQGESNDL